MSERDGIERHDGDAPMARRVKPLAASTDVPVPQGGGTIVDIITSLRAKRIDQGAALEALREQRRYQTKLLIQVLQTQQLEKEAELKAYLERRNEEIALDLRKAFAGTEEELLSEVIRSTKAVNNQVTAAVMDYKAQNWSPQYLEQSIDLIERLRDRSLNKIVEHLGLK